MARVQLDDVALTALDDGIVRVVPNTPVTVTNTNGSQAVVYGSEAGGDVLSSTGQLVADDRGRYFGWAEAPVNVTIAGITRRISGGSGGGGGSPSGAAGGDLTGTYPNPSIGSGKVLSNHIGNNQVGQAQLANLAVGTAQLAANAVDYTKIASSVWTTMFRIGLDSAKGAASAFPNQFYVSTDVGGGTLYWSNGSAWTQIAAGVTSGSGSAPTGAAGGSLAGSYPNPSLAANSVGATELANNAVDAAAIQDGVITFAKLNASAIGTSGTQLAVGNHTHSVPVYKGYTFTVPTVIAETRRGFFMPIRSNESKKIVAVRASVAVGSVTAQLNINGSGTGLPSHSVTTTSGSSDTDVNPDKTLSHGDLITLVLTSPASSPTNLVYTVICEETATTP